ncbi:class I SAM-dependent methyltransferase [Nocardia sp. NBC_00511]|uniref:class I SAM-dependent methyltransferase n=1 Tax=Nocardia sp. NBC_00511 TaxID=2903591 RepID=UPI0030E0AFED
MKTGRPSRTALATAHARAFHQISGEPRVFTDPLALRILSMKPEDSLDLDTATLDRPGGDEPRQRERRYLLAARSRFAEDTVAAAAAAGTRQVVILGAGLDTFAYRNPFPELRVFEVDHPDTQDWKRELLEQSGIAVPDTLTFVPVDFETSTLAAGLAAAGFVRDEPAVFVWLGVVMYLSRESIVETLRYAAGQTPPVQVVADYLRPGATEAERVAMAERAARIAAIGEPILSLLEPGEMVELLHSLGFDQVEEKSGGELIDDYLDTPMPELTLTVRSSRVLRATRSAD